LTATLALEATNALQHLKLQTWSTVHSTNTALKELKAPMSLIAPPELILQQLMRSQLTSALSALLDRSVTKVQEQ